jgi:4-amino-4-deoxy-L-arabinose transferase
MCGVAALRSRHPAQKIWRAAIAPMFFFAAAHFLVPDATVEMKMPAGFLSRHAPEVSADTIIITDEDAAAAVCWYLKRDDVYVLGEAGELSYGFDYEKSERHIDADKVASIISRFPGNVVLIAGAAMLERMEEHLPQNFAGSKSDFSGYLIWRRY